MDPSKPSAPGPGWTSDEKAMMGQTPPPPYQDQPQYNPAYPPANQSYPSPPQYGGPAYVQQPYPTGPGQQYPGQPGQYPGQPGQYPGQPGQYPGQPGQYPGQPGQYPGQPGVTTVTVQPTMYVTRPALEHPVNDYLGYSIFTMLCCCFPLGIAALIYSISAREANHSGDQMQAERSSRMARTLNHVSLGIGITMMILSIIYVVVVWTILVVQTESMVNPNRRGS